MTRDQVVAEALRWEGTPYHHRARVLGVGVDCAQLPLAVYHACGLIPDLDPKYTTDWMLHRDEERYLGVVRDHAREIDRGQVGRGDFAIWKYGRTYSHGAILLDPPTVLHAVQFAGAVIRGDIDRDEELRARAVKFFTLF
jgi:cell wall-associated NlpC family hydrolase